MFYFKSAHSENVTVSLQIERFYVLLRTMQVPWQRCSNDASPDSDCCGCCSTRKRACDTKDLLATPEHHGSSPWVQFLVNMCSLLYGDLDTVIIVWRDTRFPSSFISEMFGQSTSVSCWALRPLSGPAVSEVGSHLDSQTNCWVQQYPLQPPPDVWQHWYASVWVTMWPQVQLSSAMLFFSELFSVHVILTHQSLIVTWNCGSGKTVDRPYLGIISAKFNIGMLHASVAHQSWTILIKS